MLTNATPGFVTDPGQRVAEPINLLYVGSDPAPPPPPPPPPPANDNFADAPVLTGSGSVNGSSINATKEAGEPNHAGNVGGASVWYRITPTVSGIATIDTTGRQTSTRCSPSTPAPP